MVRRTPSGNSGWRRCISSKIAIGLKPGNRILKSELDASVDWINRNPFRSASVQLEPGREIEKIGRAIEAVHRTIAEAEWRIVMEAADPSRRMPEVPLARHRLRHRGLLEEG